MDNATNNSTFITIFEYNYMLEIELAFFNNICYIVYIINILA
jgi:hypothetical protein